jgi:hypothetical protein
MTRMARRLRERRTRDLGFGYSRSLDVDVKPVPSGVEMVFLTGRRRAAS